MDRGKYMEQLELAVKIISWEWNAVDRQLRLSATTKAVLGINDTILRLAQLIKLISVKDRDFILSIIRSFRNGPMINKFYFSIITGGKEIHLSVQVFTDESGGKTIAGIAQDVTEIKNAMTLIDSHVDNLNEISWTQSHVLRAPVATILGLLDMWGDSGDATERDQIIMWIKENALKLDNIIRDISSAASLP